MKKKSRNKIKKSLHRNGKITICPRHNIRCGGKYGSCPSCLGESMSDPY